MPVFLRPNRTQFPPLQDASRDGLLAVGGDLSVDRLLTAYAGGIFPWYDHSTPIMWWTPPERCILRPAAVHIPKSLRRVINSRKFTVTVDEAFPSVIRSCARKRRPGQRGTWIVPEMIAAYIRLHEEGYAHSVEAWLDGKLAGGVYGVALGGGFFGESMFFVEPEASKTAFVWLARLLEFRNFSLIDCQQVTENLLRFGAYPVTRDEFMTELYGALAIPAQPGLWTMPEGFFPLGPNRGLGIATQ